MLSTLPRPICMHEWWTGRVMLADVNSQACPLRHAGQGWEWGRTPSCRGLHETCICVESQWRAGRGSFSAALSAILLFHDWIVSISALRVVSKNIFHLPQTHSEIPFWNLSPAIGACGVMKYFGIFTVSSIPNALGSGFSEMIYMKIYSFDILLPKWQTL